MNGKRTDARWVCRDCVKPDERYFDVPLASFVGWDVKIAFESGEPESDDSIVENMWVRITGVQGEQLVGFLHSKPVFLCNVRRGDRVELKRAQIMAVESPRGEPFTTGTTGPVPPTRRFEARCRAWLR